MWGMKAISFWKAIPHVLLASQNAPSSPSDLVGGFRKVYEILEQPGAIHRLASPTLTFSYVSPPLNNQSTWNDVDLQANLPDELRPGFNPDKPIAIYLPGLDGYGISACTHQFDDLANTFQLWRLTIASDDRSSFGQVVQAVVDCVHDIAPEGTNVTLIGESCGGVLASGAALKLQDKLTGLVLVNPATSFSRTPWADLVPLLVTLPNNSNNKINGEARLTPYALLGSIILSAIIPDRQQMRRITQAIQSLPEMQPGARNPLTQQWEILRTSLQSMQNTEERLPADMLKHRTMNWLDVGADMVNRRLPLQHKAPTLVVVGAEDRLLPSKDEAARLTKVLAPNSVETLVVKDRGHFVLDDTVNLTEAIVFSKINPLQRESKRSSYDPIEDWRVPNDVHKFINEAVQPLRDAFGPVFFSTDANGKRWKGLGKLPGDKNGPLLFVANHQFIALDLRLLVAELYEQRNLLVRGLAHPITFVASEQQKRNFVDLGGRVPGLEDDMPNPFNGGFEKYGAVRVTPRNFYRLLQTGQNALLFPGGATEALSKNTSYPLFWPDKVDFVRTAARFNATIIPISAVGMVDSFNVLLEPSDLLNAPFIGEQLRQLNGNVSAARYDQKGEEEVLGVPLSFPKVPARNYFVFGKPIDTTQIDPSDKVACKQAYVEAEGEVRRGLDDVLRIRDKDPYKSTPKRLAYEKLWGIPAPSIETKELNPTQ